MKRPGKMTCRYCMRAMRPHCLPGSANTEQCLWFACTYPERPNQPACNAIYDPVTGRWAAPTPTLEEEGHR